MPLLSGLVYRKDDSAMSEKLILASASPRRLELIRFLDIPFEAIPSDAEEVSEGRPEEVVVENAKRKAEAICDFMPGRWVLGADTLVFLNEKALGKPKSPDDAMNMLRALSGRTHQVMTGICLTNGQKRLTRVSVTDVSFLPLSEEEIRSYVQSGEPMDKAGAYALQGRAGAYVKSISGSYSNVIGLDIALTRLMLEEAGLWHC